MPRSEVFIKRDVSDGEFAVYKVLNTPSVQAHNNELSVLVLPRATTFDQDSHILTLPLYEGETFNDAWNIEDGGSLMDTSLAYDIPLIIRDLAALDTGIFTDHENLSRIPNLAYHQEQAVHYFGELCLGLTQEGVLSDSEYDKVMKLLDYKQTTKPIINNGDFYPRNLIRQPDGRLVLIDWEVWNPHSPFFLIDHPENVAAVQYVHMWGNPKWQAAFRSQLDKHFSFSAKSFDKGVVIKALTLATFFRKHQALFDGQITLLKHLLSSY